MHTRTKKKKHKKEVKQKNEIEKKSHVDLIVKKSVSDTIYSANFDGMPCRVMKTPVAERRTAKPLTLWRALLKALTAARSSGRPLAALVREVLQQGFVNTLKLAYFGAATDEIRRAIEDGDHQRGIQLIGQVQGLVDDVPAVAEIMQRVLREADAALSNVNALAAPSVTASRAVGE